MLHFFVMVYAKFKNCVPSNNRKKKRIVLLGCIHTHEHIKTKWNLVYHHSLFCSFSFSSPKTTQRVLWLLSTIMNLTISLPLCRTSFFFLINLFIYLFIYLWLRWVFIAAHGLSLVAASGDYSWLQCTGVSLWWLLLLQSTGCRCVGLVVVAHQL